MSKLEKAKEIIRENFKYAEFGIFNSRNIVGDPVANLYNKGDGLIVDICYMYGYFEVFGLSEDEFDELAEYYNSLV